MIWRRGRYRVFAWFLCGPFVAIALANGNIPAIWVTAVLGSVLLLGFLGAVKLKRRRRQVHSLRRWLHPLVKPVSLKGVWAEVSQLIQDAATIPV